MGFLQCVSLNDDKMFVFDQIQEIAAACFLTHSVTKDREMCVYSTSERTKDSNNGRHKSQIQYPLLLSYYSCSRKQKDLYYMK